MIAYLNELRVVAAGMQAFLNRIDKPGRGPDDVFGALEHNSITGKKGS